LSQNKELQLLFCDGQQDDIVLKLKLPEHLMDKWNNEWKDSFIRVELFGETTKVPEGNGSLDEFGNGGIF